MKPSEALANVGVLRARRLRPIALLAAVVACGGAPATHVEIPPPAQAAGDDRATPSLDELACKPHGLVAIDADASGALDVIRLNAAMLSARDFAQRCCRGDESGDATVRVTVAPEGYQTDVAIEPAGLADGATGACLRASFHRVVVKSFRGEAKTVSIDVRIP